MRCPYCSTSFHYHPRRISVHEHFNFGWKILVSQCPECDKETLELAYGEKQPLPNSSDFDLPNPSTFLVYPRNAERVCPPEVPSFFREGFLEAAEILHSSPKASAAISRRCLQQVLRDAYDIPPSNLWQEVEDFIQGSQDPAHVKEAVHMVRQVGGFDVYPNKSDKPGEIQPVGPGEAEWNLDVLELIFEHHFVGPITFDRARTNLNSKLTEAGRTTL